MARTRGGLRACKGLKGCAFAKCVEQQLGKAPRKMKMKC